jgi:hypothetical protein
MMPASFSMLASIAALLCARKRVIVACTVHMVLFPARLFRRSKGLAAKTCNTPNAKSKMFDCQVSQKPS